MAESVPKKSGQEKKVKPVTVRIEDFKYSLNQAVAESELPPFMLELLIGEYLAGISQVARREYEQERAEWERECKQDG